MCRGGIGIRMIGVLVLSPWHSRSLLRSSFFRKFTCKSISEPHLDLLPQHVADRPHPVHLLRKMSKLIQDFLKEKTHSSASINAFVIPNLGQFSTCHLITIQYMCSKQNTLLDSELVELLADEIDLREDLFNVVDVSNSLYALKMYSSKSPAVRKLISVLTRKIDLSTEAFGNQCIGNALYGLQNCSSSHKEVCELLRVLTPRITASNTYLDSQHVSAAMYGLRNMQSHAWEVRSILSALARKIEASPCVFGAQQVGNCLYGMQGMHCRHVEVRDMLRVLGSKISRNREHLQAQHIGNCLYGLRNMRSETVEVRDLLRVLVPVIQRSKVGLDGQAVGNGLLGIRGLSSDCEEVRALLMALCEKMLFLKSRLTAQHICNALSGLRRLSTQHREVVRLVSSLENHIYKSVGTDDKLRLQSFTFEGICFALYGLRSMPAEEVSVRRLLRFIGNVFQHLRHTSPPQVRISGALPGHISMAMNGLRQMSLDCDEVRQLLIVLLEELSVCAVPFSLQQITLILRGISHMDSSDNLVKTILITLHDKLSELLEREDGVVRFQGEDVARAVGCLRERSCQSLETRRVLSQLNLALQQCKQQRGFMFSAADVLLILSGLERMSSESVEVMSVMHTLGDIIRQCDGSTGNIAWSEIDKDQIVAQIKRMHDPQGRAIGVIGSALFARDEGHTNMIT